MWSKRHSIHWVSMWTTSRLFETKKLGMSFFCVCGRMGFGTIHPLYSLGVREILASFSNIRFSKTFEHWTNGCAHNEWRWRCGRCNWFFPHYFWTIFWYWEIMNFGQITNLLDLDNLIDYFYNLNDEHQGINCPVVNVKPVLLLCARKYAGGRFFLRTGFFVGSQISTTFFILSSF